MWTILIAKPRNNLTNLLYLLDWSPTEPGLELGNVAADVLPLLQLHYSVDRWWSADVQCGTGRPPAVENGQCITVPLWCTGPWTKPTLA